MRKRDIIISVGTQSFVHRYFVVVKCVILLLLPEERRREKEGGTNYGISLCYAFFIG